MALAERLAGVRERMETDGVDFYLVPSSDAHQVSTANTMPSLISEG